MSDLTEQGREIVDDLSQRHGVSPAAAQHMLVAVLNGNGSMAQFSHPEFGGSGQWMSGGMTMVSDMFNNYLKGRVDSICSDIAATLQRQPGLLQAGSFQSQSQSGSGTQVQTAGDIRGESNLFVPDPELNWWPKELGRPNATGSQNDIRYAYFSSSRRLAVKTGNSVWVYDTHDHQIAGFSQQQGISGNITFTSQFGTVALNSLPLVTRDGQSVTEAFVKPIAAKTFVIPPDASPVLPPAPVTAAISPRQPEGDIFTAIEKLGDLKAKGILTDDEFSEKKKELLSRL